MYKWSKIINVADFSLPLPMYGRFVFKNTLSVSETNVVRRKLNRHEFANRTLKKIQVTDILPVVIILFRNTYWLRLRRTESMRCIILPSNWWFWAFSAVWRGPKPNFVLLQHHGRTTLCPILPDRFARYSLSAVIRRYFVTTDARHLFSALPATIIHAWDSPSARRNRET